MSEHKHEAKKSAADKLSRMGLHKEHKMAHFDDHSPWDGVPELTTDLPRGKLPVGKQRFKRGGKVADVHGEKARQNLGHSPRKKRDDDGEFGRGGITGKSPAARKRMVGAMVARKKKEGLASAPPMTAGTVPSPSKIGAFTGVAPYGRKSGGAAKHPDEAEDKALIKSMVKGKALKEGKCWGGRAKKDDGVSISLKKMPSGAMQYVRGDTPEERRENINKYAISAYDNADNDLISTGQNRYSGQQKALAKAMIDEVNDRYPGLVTDPYKKGGRAKKAGGGGTDDPFEAMGSDTFIPNFQFKGPQAEWKRDQEPKTHHVYNSRTGEKVGSYKNYRRARNVVDKKDNEYGSYAHHIVPEYNHGGRAHKAGGGSIRSQFNDAFREARNAGQDTFEFNGKMYNTQLAPNVSTGPSKRGTGRPTSTVQPQSSNQAGPASGNFDTSEAARYGQIRNLMHNYPEEFGNRTIGQGVNPGGYYSPKSMDNFSDMDAARRQQNEINMRNELAQMRGNDLNQNMGQHPTDEDLGLNVGENRGGRIGKAGGGAMGMMGSPYQGNFGGVAPGMQGGSNMGNPGMARSGQMGTMGNRFQGNRPGMMPGVGMHENDYNHPGMFNNGGRVQRATGGRTKAGKTNVNIIISPQSGGQGQGPLGMGTGMGNPPVPPMMPQVPPQMPPQMPPGMGAAGAGPGLGAMGAMAPGGMGMSAPVPPMRKAGGRVQHTMPKYQETEFGSGSGLGRLEKKKWPAADGTP